MSSLVISSLIAQTVSVTLKHFLTRFFAADLTGYRRYTRPATWPLKELVDSLLQRRRAIVGILGPQPGFLKDWSILYYNADGLS